MQQSIISRLLNSERSLFRLNNTFFECIQLAVFETKDCLFDCCWSEVKESLLVVALADGLIQIFDTVNGGRDPVMVLSEHSKEVATVRWNQHRQDAFLSGSWDCLIKLWSTTQSTSIRTFERHQH